MNTRLAAVVLTAVLLVTPWQQQHWQQGGSGVLLADCQGLAVTPDNLGAGQLAVVNEFNVFEDALELASELSGKGGSPQPAGLQFCSFFKLCPDPRVTPKCSPAHAVLVPAQRTVLQCMLCANLESVGSLQVTWRRCRRWKGPWRPLWQWQAWRRWCDNCKRYAAAAACQLCCCRITTGVAA
jgi:hypothetical protein